MCHGDRGIFVMTKQLRINTQMYPWHTDCYYYWHKARNNNNNNNKNTCQTKQRIHYINDKWWSLDAIWGTRDEYGAFIPQIALFFLSRKKNMKDRQNDFEFRLTNEHMNSNQLFDFFFFFYSMDPCLTTLIRLVLRL